MNPKEAFFCIFELTLIAAIELLELTPLVSNHKKSQHNTKDLQLRCGSGPGEPSMNLRGPVFDRSVFGSETQVRYDWTRGFGTYTYRSVSNDLTRCDWIFGALAGFDLLVKMVGPIHSNSANFGHSNSAKREMHHRYFVNPPT